MLLTRDFDLKFTLRKIEDIGWKSHEWDDVRYLEKKFTDNDSQEIS